ncbi:MAG: Ltp family lipoprotein [Ilumatobacteraceae bacterium]
MTNDFPSPQLPPPSEQPTQFVPVVSTPHAAWLKRKLFKLPLWAWIAVGVLTVGAIGSAAKPKQDGAEPVAGSATDVATTQMPSTVAATTVPATTVPATTPLTTTPPVTEPPSTTEAPTTVPPPTTAVCVNGEFDATGTQVCYGGVFVPKPEMTASQENAVRTAQNYLDFSAFSRQGLIDQLSSEYGSQFPIEDATFAVDSLNVDWNAQAAKQAQDYLDFSGFSCQSLIDQLSSQYGSQFTIEQATYGASQVGLC